MTNYANPTFKNVTLTGSGSAGNISGMTVTDSLGNTQTTATKANSIKWLKANFGAYMDTQMETVSVTTTSGSTSLVVSSGIFTAADTGKNFLLTGAGAGGSMLFGTLTYVSPTQCTMSVAAGTTLGASVNNSAQTITTLLDSGNTYRNGVGSTTVTIAANSTSVTLSESFFSAQDAVNGATFTLPTVNGGFSSTIASYTSPTQATLATPCPVAVSGTTQVQISQTLSSTTCTIGTVHRGSITPPPPKQVPNGLTLTLASGSSLSFSSGNVGGSITVAWTSAYGSGSFSTTIETYISPTQVILLPGVGVAYPYQLTSAGALTDLAALTATITVNSVPYSGVTCTIGIQSMTLTVGANWFPTDGSWNNRQITVTGAGWYGKTLSTFIRNSSALPNQCMLGFSSQMQIGPASNTQSQVLIWGHDDTPAFNNAWNNFYNAAPNNTLMMEPGIVWLATASGTTDAGLAAYTTQVNNASLVGSSIDATAILWNDAGSTWNGLGNFNLFCGGLGATNRPADLLFADFTVIGTCFANGENLTNPNATQGGGNQGTGGYPWIIKHCDRPTLKNIGSKWSRVFGIGMDEITDGRAISCVVQHSARDGINISDCLGLLIDNPQVYYSDDNAIAVHDQSASLFRGQDTVIPVTTGPASIGIRRGVHINGGRVYGSGGISFLAAREITVTGLRIGLSKTIAGGFTGGSNVTASSINISGVDVTDCISATNWDFRNPELAIGWLIAANPSAGSIGAIPGESTGSGVIDPYPYYLQNTTVTTNPVGGAVGVIMSNCSFRRTLTDCNGIQVHPVTTYPINTLSDSGIGFMWTAKGWIDPPLAAQELGDYGFYFRGGTFRDFSLVGNVISGFKYGYNFIDAPSGPITSTTRIANFRINGGIVTDCSHYGLNMTNTGAFDLSLDGVTFDLDPFLKSTSRGASGTWTSNNALPAIVGTLGISAINCKFLNCSTPAYSSTLTSASNFFDRNLLYGTFTAPGFSSSANKGVGNLVTAGFIPISMQSDPTLANFGKIVQTPTYFTGSISAAGSGQSTSTLLPAIRNVVTTGTGGVQANLLIPQQYVRNSTGSAILIYPTTTSGTTIDGTSSFSLASGLSVVLYDDGNGNRYT